MVLYPVLKAMDDFHQILYIIYRKLLPDSKYEEIAGLTGTLPTKAEAIVNSPQDRLKTRLGVKLEADDSFSLSLSLFICAPNGQKL
jgi:hypothetical protein